MLSLLRDEGADSIPSQRTKIMQAAQQDQKLKKEKGNQTHLGQHMSCNCSVPKSGLTLQPHGPQRARLLCPSPSPRVCANACPLSWWFHPTISSCLPASVFNLSQHQGLFQWVRSSNKYYLADFLHFKQYSHVTFPLINSVSSEQVSCWIFRRLRNKCLHFSLFYSCLHSCQTLGVIFWAPPKIWK